MFEQVFISELKYSVRNSGIWMDTNWHAWRSKIRPISCTYSREDNNSEDHT